MPNDAAFSRSAAGEGSKQVDRGVLRAMRELAGAAPERLRWLHDNVPDLFAGPMREDAEAVAALAAGLPRLQSDRQLVLADRAHELILARLDVPGSIFATVRRIQDLEISCAEMSHSYAPVPGTDRLLELQRYEFEPKSQEAVAAAGEPEIPERVRRAVHAAIRARYPDLRPAALDPALALLWLNHERFVRLAEPGAVAQLLWLYRQGQEHGGIFLHAEEPEPGSGTAERHLLFAVANPPQQGYLAQVLEVFNALDLGVRRALVLSVSTGKEPWLVGSFHVAHRQGERLANDSDLFRRLRRQLYNTQILSAESETYRDLVLPGLMTGEEGSLVNAFIGFCHTNCAHNQPHRFTFEDVIRCFHSQPEIALRLVRLFEARFDPDVPDRETRYPALLAELEKEVADYNTGHRMLDEFRRAVFQATLTFVKRTLKTNFFVPEKQALAFRLDPAYLDDLGPDFTADLPPERPFRVTFFFARAGLGYHVGFSDIARGGWRTVFTETRDDYVTVANFVFRETYVLAHTQHLKNKDIYEGGSKLVVVLRAPALKSKERVNQRLYKVQTAFINAFLDVFVTRDGKAAEPRVLDYYGEDEPIELGPDENMHDVMIENIAELSARRGYVLGKGIISSKRVGINHKQYGVTSTGVVTFAGIAMREQGVDIRRDPFSVKLTGGPNGDVAGNAIRLLLERCPKVELRLIVDGTGALFDPRGLARDALARIVLQADAEAFDPAALSPGGFALYRNVRRTEGLRELYRRVEMTEAGLRETWVTVDEFHKEYGGLLFKVPADLFIPAGGRPETIDAENWRRFLGKDGAPSARVVVEGANSFITPAARDELQRAGVVVLRDASANKCGVITSSYEIIGNLLLTEKEFLAHKEEYVRDVLAILERRAADEANLIFRRHREEKGQRSFTELSAALSVEINAHKARLFRFFEAHPELCLTPRYRRALLAHLPRLVRDTPVYRSRLSRLPAKYRSAILAAEIATAIVYRGGFELDFERAVEAFVAQSFA
ncbi:NAD-glutamate dehydrogenase domain-containing protein [Anaeromyxobacter paludicola]|uniref:Amino acid dehydrogenase n=1 Tax=Anaeromyxobacter paludicola TaxID=2918171 RepID=A0ABN6N280_9BACT|nr:NAD-glutamate dehydrogenase domain-containing protein [Anaeromyxobacter paludicola]BDG07310.1 amino acid dehydrogenase [Anaeromyxobacter paludicola]